LGMQVKVGGEGRDALDDPFQSLMLHTSRRQVGRHDQRRNGGQLAQLPVFFALLSLIVDLIEALLLSFAPAGGFLGRNDTLPLEQSGINGRDWLVALELPV